MTITMPDRVQRGWGRWSHLGSFLSLTGILGGQSAQQGSGQQGALWREQRRALWRQKASRLLLRRLPARPLQTCSGRIMDRNPSPPPLPRNEVDQEEEEVVRGDWGARCTASTGSSASSAGSSSWLAQMTRSSRWSLMKKWRMRFAEYGICQWMRYGV